MLNLVNLFQKPKSSLNYHSTSYNRRTFFKVKSINELYFKPGCGSEFLHQVLMLVNFGSKLNQSMNLNFKLYLAFSLTSKF